MPNAARITDLTNHPGVVGPPPPGPPPDVMIEGKPAATVGSPHTCSFPGTPPHPPTMIVPPGSTTVFINKKPAARVGDKSACGAAILPPGALMVVIN
jgi:uncharacterized Zn-binding protein involved in type VI secretion